MGEDSLSKILENLVSPTNFSFALAISIIVVFGLIGRQRAFAAKTPPSELVRLMPGMATTVGIFGTFTGIYLGLVQFDVNEISKSVPPLLDGMKTAFSTSLLGIFASLVLRNWYAFIDGKQSRNAPETSEDPLTVLRAIQQHIDELTRSVTSTLRSDEEYSMLSQMKLIRSEIRDTRDQLSRDLERFADELAKQGMERLVGALQQVMQDFNTLLNELVGAAFNDLKTSVVNLNQWQSEHREQLSTMHANLSALLEQTTRAATSISNLDPTLNSISQSVEKLSVDGAALENAVGAMRAQLNAMSAFLSEIERLGTEARAVLPSVQQHVTQYVEELGRAIETQRQTNDQALTALRQTVSESTTRLSSAHQEQEKALRTQIEGINKGLEESLQASLGSLVGALTQVSERFAQDYTPLAERLREVVQIAQSAPLVRS